MILKVLKPFGYKLVVHRVVLEFVTGNTHLLCICSESALEVQLEKYKAKHSSEISGGWARVESYRHDVVL